MNLQFNVDHEKIRNEVRAFLERDYPKEILEKARSGQLLDRLDHVRSERALQSRGWLAIAWPKAHGGPGWDPVQRYIFEEELDRAGVPHLLPMAIIYIGPVIYTFGTVEQQRQWLPDILESRAMWAQGYSEVGAGSDLAGLSLQAQRDGDDYVLDGTKMWTTFGHWADWIFCLVRTSQEEPRQDGGITFLCARMSSPGITVHPIITLDGTHVLNRIEFENVRVPVSQRIGDEGKGWHYSRYLLHHERLSYAHVSRKKEDLRALRRLAAATPSDGGGWMIDDRRFAARIAECEIAVAILEISVLRVLTAVKDGAPAEASTLKIFATQTTQRISELWVELGGHSASVFLKRAQSGWTNAAPLVAPTAVTWMASYLHERAQTIFGGTTEIQKNIIWRMLRS
jgi:alkylation response protein AidB-like acyl-CoA dehydrogenase